MLCGSCEYFPAEELVKNCEWAVRMTTRHVSSDSTSMRPSSKVPIAEHRDRTDHGDRTPRIDGAPVCLHDADEPVSEDN